MEYVDSIAQAANDKIDFEVKDLARTSDLADAIYSIDDKIMEFKEKVADDLTQFQEINASIEDITSKMQKFALTKDMNVRFDEVESRFKGYLKMRDFENHKQSIEEITMICKKNIDNFNIDNVQMKTIVKRFDEVILDKASKHRVKLLEDKLAEFVLKIDFDEFRKSNTELLTKLESDFLMLCSKVDANYEDLYEVFHTTMREMAPEIKQDVLNTLNQRIVDQDEFKALMKLKVNKTDFEALNLSKASKVEYK